MTHDSHDLATLDRLSVAALIAWGQRSIAEAGSFDTLRKLKATAQAIEAYRKSIGAAEEAIAAASEIRLRADRRMGEVLTEGQADGSIARVGTNQIDLKAAPGRHTPPATSRDLGMTRRAIAELKHMAEPTLEQFEVIIREATAGRLGERRTHELARDAARKGWTAEQIRDAAHGLYPDLAPEPEPATEPEPDPLPAAPAKVVLPPLPLPATPAQRQALDELARLVAVATTMPEGAALARALPRWGHPKATEQVQAITDWCDDFLTVLEQGALADRLDQQQPAA